VLLIWAVSLPAAWAQAPVLFAFDGADPLNPPPSHAGDAYGVHIAMDVLLAASPGEGLLVQLAPEQFQLIQLVDTRPFINGDQVFHIAGDAGGDYFSLILTVGSDTLYGHLSSVYGIYQLEAARSPGSASDWHGWFYRPQGLSGASLLHDDVLIPPVAPQPHRPPVMPLQLGGEAAASTRLAGGGQQAASQDQISPQNFRIEQALSRRALRVGETVDITVDLHNISGQTHRGLTVDFYFVLENSELQSRPGGCAVTVSISAQQILRCPLGDFAPGESRSLTYSVRAAAASRPAILSTAIVGAVRSDASVNVVEDVRTDSDGDGISDFNESLNGTDARNPSSRPPDQVVIDVMALYTPGAEARYPRGVITRINQLVSVANQVYADSGVGITLRPVYHGLVDYNDTDDMDTALSHIMDRTHPAFATVEDLRSTYGADLVMLFRPLGGETGRCGLATLGGLHTDGDFSNPQEKRYGYSHIGIDCPVDLVLAHELGHNMGLTHSLREDGYGGTFDFSTGHGVDGEFATVMALPAAFHTDNRIALFSNPQLDCRGMPCGVPAGEANGADAVQTLNLVKYQIAQYYPTRVPDLPGRMVASSSGKSTDASIAIAATTDKGLSYVQAVRPGDVTDVRASIAVDPRHVGQSGIIHVLVDAGSDGYLQYLADGKVLPWDGTVADLRGYRPLQPLRPVEYISLLEDFRPDASMVGGAVSIYVVYELPQQGEFIYTAEPLNLRVVSATSP
jgi:hypothetical protein